MEAFSILDPQGLLGEPADDQLRVILDHYKDGPLAINPGDCLKEHSEFVEVVKSHTHLKNCKTLVELAEKVVGNDAVSSLFHIMTKLLVRAVVLPVSTADCERCFSTMSRIKTDLRNRMSTDALQKLIQIRLEGPDDLNDFDFKEACHRWAKLKNRRILL